VDVPDDAAAAAATLSKNPAAGFSPAKNAPFFSSQLSLCLSRAWLGKKIVFKHRHGFFQKAFFAPPPPSLLSLLSLLSPFPPLSPTPGLTLLVLELALMATLSELACARIS
jgi:hypothetical protein